MSMDYGMFIKTYDKILNIINLNKYYYCCHRDNFFFVFFFSRKFYPFYVRRQIYIFKYTFFLYIERILYNSLKQFKKN